jgi:hypothetical protein
MQRHEKAIASFDSLPLTPDPSLWRNWHTEKSAAADQLAHMKIVSRRTGEGRGVEVIAKLKF